LQVLVVWYKHLALLTMSVAFAPFYHIRMKLYMPPFFQGSHL